MATMKPAAFSTLLTPLSGPPQRHLASLLLLLFTLKARARDVLTLLPSLGLDEWLLRRIGAFDGRASWFYGLALSPPLASIDSGFLFTHTAVHGA